MQRTVQTAQEPEDPAHGGDVQQVLVAVAIARRETCLTGQGISAGARSSRRTSRISTRCAGGQPADTCSQRKRPRPWPESRGLPASPHPQRCTHSPRAPRQGGAHCRLVPSTAFGSATGGRRPGRCALPPQVRRPAEGGDEAGCSTSTHCWGCCHCWSRCCRRCWSAGAVAAATVPASLPELHQGWVRGQAQPRNLLLGDFLGAASRSCELALVAGWSHRRVV